MNKVSSPRLATIVSTFSSRVVATTLTTALTTALTAAITAMLFFTLPVAAAPRAQSTLPDFTLNAQTVLTVTVAITDGQIIVIPLNLNFVTENENGRTDVSLISDVEQQVGIFIGVAPTTAISATLQLPGAATAEQSTLPSGTTGNGEGTHVTNTNSRLRAGPGTNFDIVGRVPQGGAVTIVGENADGTWLLLDNGAWIAEFLVEPIEPAPSNNQNNDSEGDAADEEEATVEPLAAAENEASVANAAPDIEDQGEVLFTALGTTDDLTSYLATLTTIGAETMLAVESLTALVGEPDPQSEQWRNALATQLTALSGALDQYLALTPVTGYEDVHSQVIDMALTCEQAVDYIVTGLANPLNIDTAVASQTAQACVGQSQALAAVVETLP